MQKDKKKWGKPKLIVLVRGDRQERVLSGCKLIDGIDFGPNSPYHSCTYDAAGFGNPCGDWCMMLVLS